MAPSTSSESSASPPRLGSLRLLLKNGVGIRSLALTVLMLLAVLGTLYFAKPVVLPIVLALLMSLLLAPFVRGLRQKFHLPMAASAALVMLVLLGSLGTAASLAVGPALSWMQSVPARMPELKNRLTSLQKPLTKMREAGRQVEELTDLNKNEGVREVKIKSPPAVGLLVNQTPAFLANLAMMFILTYFMLASGDLFLRKLVRMIPSFEDKRHAVEIAREIEDCISGYLRTITAINLALGVSVGVAAFFVGLENYVLWGVLATLLNFIPYLGAVVGVTATLLAGLFTFDSLGHACLLPAIYAGLNALEGNFITPSVVGRILTLNPVMVFIFLMFWGWIWGVVGALLAVPILAVLKIVCDHLKPLAPIGEFIGGERLET